jgi:hypothetical protein
MKKIFTVVLMIAMCAMLYCVPVFAEEVVEIPESEAVSDITPEETAEEPDFLDRVIEMIDEGKIWELCTLLATALLFALAYVLKKKIAEFAFKLTTFSKNVTDKVQEGSNGTIKALGDSASILAEVVSENEKKLVGYIDHSEAKMSAALESAGVNIDAFKASIEAKMDELGAKIDEKLASNMRETRKAERMLADVAKILNTVYMGSSTIPSITKEKVMEIYESAEKKLGAGEESNNE